MRRVVRIIIKYEDGSDLWIEPQDVEKMLQAEEALKTLNRAIEIGKRLSALNEVK